MFKSCYNIENNRELFITRVWIVNKVVGVAV